MPYLIYKYRIYPTPEQVEFLLATMDSCDQVFNFFLDLLEEMYAESETVVPRRDMQKMLAEMRRNDPEMAQFDIHAQRHAIYRVDNAYAAFLNGVRDKPRHREPTYHTRSFTTDSDAQKIKDGKLSVPKLGTRIKIKLHRPIEGKIKTMTIKLERSGQWNAYFACELDDADLPAPAFTDNARKEIGIDVGIHDFATDSNGVHHTIPNFKKDAAKKIAKEQRRLSRMKHGSKNWEKRRKKLAKVYQHVSNQQGDAIHKLSAEVVAENDLLIMEDLDIRQMGHIPYIGKHTSKMGWHKFAKNVEYKAERAGKSFVKVERHFPSSQLCSECGFQNEKMADCSVRRWTCPACGAKHDRDENAAKNIRDEGVRMFDKKETF